MENGDHHGKILSSDNRNHPEIEKCSDKVDDKKHITELHLSIGATGAPAP